jgi:hypothetical protein
MKKFLPILLVSLFVLLIVTIFLLMSMNTPNVNRIKNVSYSKPVSKILSVVSEIELESENWFPTHAYDLSFTISYNNHIIGSSKTIPNKRIKTGVFNIPVTIDYFLDSIETYLKNDILSDSIQATVELKGKITFMGLGSSNSFVVWLPTKPMNDAIFVQLASENKFELEKIQVVESTLLQTKLQADFKLTNESSLDFNLESVSCDLFLDSTQQKSIAKWTNSEKHLIKAGSSKVINGFFEIDNLSAAYKSADKVLTGNVDLLLSGKVVLNKNGDIFEIPLVQKIPYDMVFSEISNVLTW